MKRTGTRLALLVVLFAAALWLLFTINRLPTAPGTADALPDSVVLASSGYHISTQRSGLVRVRFPLNERGVGAEEIAATWDHYPEEAGWEHEIPEADAGALFALASRRRLQGVKRRYVASGSAVPVVYELTTYAGDRVQRRITFDDSGSEEWPLELTALVGTMLAAAAPPGRELPLRATND